MGTANLGFAHKQSLVATDLTPFGHHRAFLMRLFSSGVNIAGRDVGHMFELHMHAFEPMQEVSYFLLLLRRPWKRQEHARQAHAGAADAEGWVTGSGSSSVRTHFLNEHTHGRNTRTYWHEPVP